jgi:sugar phosphate isomerase/epimerase
MPKRVSFQLYSARNFQPWDGVVAHLAKCGYSEVEGFGGSYGTPGAFFDEPEKFRDLLDKHGLKMNTSHLFPLDLFEKEKKRVLNLGKVFGIKYFYCPYLLPEHHPKSGAGWKAFGKRLNETAKWMHDEGYGFGWHNHEFEFKKLVDGSTPHERIFEAAPVLDWQMDIGWLARTGANPVKYIKDYGERITCVHVKDNAPKGQNLDQMGQCDVGSGTIKWPEVFKALRDNSRCVTFTVEADNPKDFKSFAKNSLKYLAKI